nr:hypothetical protein [Mesorhizobium loti]
MTFYCDPSDVNLDASYDFDSNIDVNFDLYSDIDSNLDVNHDIDVCVDINGNEATFAIDVQAYGHDTATDLNLVVAVQENEWSSITATGYAAAG